jgi:septal ring factor EnvC (AmiA/AmiB activator)
MTPASTVPLRTRLAILLLAAGFAATPCFGQPPSPSATEMDKTGKKCDTLKQRIAKEESSLATFEQTLAQDKKGRESCSTKPMCARYDDAIKRMETRKSEHEQRLAKFKADAVQACAAS